MGSTFNPHILVDKLSKLNSSQQSIETLSHWCIFHMNKAKQVVETWDRQFHCAPREQRLAYLYLANDILQNSRRKGVEFVAQFWKVLPDALRDVMENGGEKAALRLINIWEDRKVFGSRVQILKEEFGKRQLDNDSRNRKLSGPKQHSAGGNPLDKLVSGYETINNCQLDEDAIFIKCKNAISFLEKVDKDVNGDFQLVHVNGGIGDELKEQHGVLRDCIEQLAVVESARANLVSQLQETLQEQVYKLDQVRDILQTAQTRLGQAGYICRQLPGSNGNGQVLAGSLVSDTPQKPIPRTGEQTTSVTYTLQAPFAEKSSHIEEDPKAAAAAMAEKLAASSSSAQMLQYVFSSLASEGMIGNPINESSGEYPSEKRAKLLENEHPSYVPQISRSPPVTSQELNTNEQPPPPPTSPPPMPPMPPPIQSYPVPAYMQTAMPMLSGSYGYTPSLQPPLPSPGYTPAAAGVIAPPSNANAYQSYPPESGFYGQPSALPMAPMSRQ